MLHAISWGQFGAFLFVSLVVYYGYVVFAYYRRELWGIVGGAAVSKDRGKREAFREKRDDRGEKAGSDVPGNAHGVGTERGDLGEGVRKRGDELDNDRPLGGRMGRTRGEDLRAEGESRENERRVVDREENDGQVIKRGESDRREIDRERNGHEEVKHDEVEHEGNERSEGTGEVSRAEKVDATFRRRMEELVGNPVGKQRNLFPGQAAPGEQTPELFKVMEKVIVRLRGVIDVAQATGLGREELEERVAGVLMEYRHLVRTPYAVAINNFLSRSCMTHFSLQLTELELNSLWSR